MSCKCRQFGHLELCREDITKRIKQSVNLKRSLEIIAERKIDTCKLLKCPECDQFWQSSWAWNWGDKEYLFKVPHIKVSDWLTDPYCQPDKLLIYSASMQRFMELNNFIEKDAECRANSCRVAAVRNSIFCLKHHIESLQDAGALPKMPKGRWFAPYVQG